MSRQSTAAQRNLTLTEELEKLEQSITLTLQEIDHNFSRAHRIVTTSILPIVEQYREHSDGVWEGSKFWKQFFEASANVSLSGYEEPPPDVGEDEETMTASPTASAQESPSTSSYASPQHDHDSTLTPDHGSNLTWQGQQSPMQDDATPRPTQKSSRQKRAQLGKPAKTAPYSSPFETLKRKTLGRSSYADPLDSPSDSAPPSTPHGQTSPSAGAGDPQSSPFAPPSTNRHTGRRTPVNDVLLHRVLDKNWRIQATPHSTARLPHNTRHPYGEEQQTPAWQPQRQRGAASQNVDLDSSPAAPAPELHSEIFTPARKARTPGVSVLTPTRRPRKDSAPSAQKPHDSTQDLDWDSDEEEAGMRDFSPPKTIQFHVPQSRLVRTPAREASKRIVDDLLMTAGMDDGLEETEEEGSPSIIKTGGLLEEDTF